MDSIQLHPSTTSSNYCIFTAISDALIGTSIVGQETQPFEDLLSSSRGAMPERHVQLFRSLAVKLEKLPLISPSMAESKFEAQDSCNSSGNATMLIVEFVWAWDCFFDCSKLT